MGGGEGDGNFISCGENSFSFLCVLPLNRRLSKYRKRGREGTLKHEITEQLFRKLCYNLFVETPGRFVVVQPIQFRL